MLAFNASAQTCNTNDITLSSQSEVNGFQATYGPCTQVAFKLTINGADITDLSALSGLVKVGTDLTISGNDSLTSLAGLHNIGSTGNQVRIQNNARLANVGLASLITVGTDLTISSNALLASLDGLSNVVSTGNQLRIQNNPLLTSIGLNSFTTVGTDITIDNNDSLKSLDGLEGVFSSGNQLRIQNNAMLTNIDGLSGFTRVGTDLSILNNPRLTSCTGIANLVDSVDDDVPGPGPGSGGVPDVGAQVSLGGNLAGCNSIAVITEVAEIIFGNQACNTNDITLGSQSAVDAFQATYGPCTRISFRFAISGSDITDLSPLLGLTKIGTDLTISANDALTTLTGLGNIGSTGNQVRIQNNPQLTSVGLSALTIVGTDLTIDNNDSLVSLDDLCSVTSTGNQVRIQNNARLASVGLASLITVGTDLTLDNNDALRTLDGLENINSTGNQLRVQNNALLTNINGLGGFLKVGTDLSVISNLSLSSCVGIVKLVDQVDDGAPGPGPGSGGVPDVGAQVNISGNLLGCNSVGEVLEYIFRNGFE